MNTTTKAHLRRAAAWLIAPLVSVVTLWIVFIASAWLILPPADVSDWSGSAMHWLPLFVMFGFPIALVLTATIAWPAAQYLRTRGYFALLPVLTIACVLGVSIVAVLWSLLDGDFRPRNMLGVLLSGVLVGSSGAFAFWVVEKVLVGGAKW